ncbi:MAG: flagellar brake protein [Deltaproteobacteria bacterium]|jgi:c-di-GMP-binding flagellar brake protein YcgR|nr:flagellar brake protein [Deltaproteobacteria bacterium]
MSDGSVIFSADTLTPGQRVRLLAMESIKSKWSTVLIGSRPQRYIVLEVPKINGLPIVLDEQSQWSVTFINKGQIFSFPSNIISTINRPFPLAFLSWPENVSISNLRTDKRYPVNIPITFSRLEGAKEPIAKGLLLDLSWGGCLAATTMDIPEEESLSLNLYLDNDTVIEGLLVEKKGGRNQQGTFYTGLSFLPSNKVEVTDRLGDFLNEIENMPLRL